MYDDLTANKELNFCQVGPETLIIPAKRVHGRNIYYPMIRTPHELHKQANFTPAWMTTLFIWVHRLGGKDGSGASVAGKPGERSRGKS
jgi:hypothetical protein